VKIIDIKNLKFATVTAKMGSGVDFLALSLVQ